MYTFHGWAEIDVSDDEALNPSYETRMAAAIKATREAINSHTDDFSIFELRKASNNMWVLMVHGLRNRAHESAIDLFRWLSCHLPESYGLLYVRDGNDPQHDNVFKVYRLARGRLDALSDPFLSPCIPTIERAYGEA